jgi:hypothetical protein
MLPTIHIQYTPWWVYPVRVCFGLIALCLYGLCRYATALGVEALLSERFGSNSFEYVSGGSLCLTLILLLLVICYFVGKCVLDYLTGD